MTDNYGRTEHEIALSIDGGHRAELIQGLIDLAHHLAANPHIPVPQDVQVHFSVHRDSDSAAQAEVARIASELHQATSTDPASGHCSTQLDFGPYVAYRAVAIPHVYMAQWDLAMQVFHSERDSKGAAA